MGTINHPKHYTRQPIECIQLAEHFNFNLGNAIKYLWRYRDKNGAEDLKKARWYLNREMASGRKPCVIDLPDEDWVSLTEELLHCDFGKYQGLAITEIVFCASGKRDALAKAVCYINALLDEVKQDGKA